MVASTAIYIYSLNGVHVFLLNVGINSVRQIRTMFRGNQCKQWHGENKCESSSGIGK